MANPHYSLERPHLSTAPSNMDHVLAIFADFRGIDNNRRRAAEEQINQFHTQPGFSSVLLQIILNQELDFNTRHLAGVNLKILTRAHWSRLDDKFQEPELTLQEKEDLKQHTPNLLSDPSTKIRTQAAQIMTIMAGWDWPAQWPGLVENLTLCLQSDDLHLVHGAMKTLDMFASGKNLTDVHIPLLVDVVFPQLQRIFGENAYPERIRMRAVRILFSIVTWLGLVKSVYPQHTSRALKPTLPAWYELFIAELSKPDEFGAGHGSKIGVLQTIHQLLTDFPEFIKSSLPHMLEPLWLSLQSGVAIWERTSVYGNEKDNSGYDSDAGDEIGFKNYLCMLVEVFTLIDEKKKMQGLLEHGLSDLAYVVLRLVQLSDYQASLYDEDPSQYLIEEDEEDLMAFSIRTQASKLLHCISTSMDGHGAQAIHVAVQRLLGELEAYQQQPDFDAAVFDRKREGLLYGVGIALRAWSDAAEDLSLGGMNPHGSSVADIPFDVAGIVKVILVDVESNSMILRGRAMWCASIALKMLPDFAAFFAAAQEVIESGEGEIPLPEETDPQVLFLSRHAAAAMQTPDAPLPYLLHAAACVTELSPLLDKVALKEVVGVVLSCLSVLAPNLEDASLVNLLESVGAWIEIDAETTAQNIDVILDNTLEAWSRNSADPNVPPLISVIIQRLCHLPEVLAITQAKVGAVITQIYADAAARDNGLIEAATDVLGHLMLESPWPLPDLLLHNIIPQLFEIMLTTIDNSMLQSGCIALVALVRCGKENLAQYSITLGEEATNALEATIQVVDRVLNAPELNDHAGFFVGPLISKLIDSCSTGLADRVEAILQSVVLRLPRSESSTLTQDLLQVFALLMRQNLELVLQFLVSFQMPTTGESALQYVLSVWTKTFEDRHGNYQMKVSILALSSMFGNPLLADVQVPADGAIEDAIADADEAIGTRTRASKRRVPSSVPRTESLNTRIFRLMLREHMWILEEREAPVDMDEEDDFTFDPEGEYNADGDSPFTPAGDFDEDNYGSAVNVDRMFQSRMNLDDEETDPDILNDPAYQMDVESFIYEWMLGLATNNVEAFDFCVSQLSSVERDHLIQKLIQSRAQE